MAPAVAAGGAGTGCFVEAGAEEGAGSVAAGRAGGDVVGRAHGHVRHRQLGLLYAAELGEAEVGDLRLALEGDHDVGRFDVAVDDAFAMGVLEGLADLPHPAGDVLRGESAGLDEGVQVGALDVLHHEVEPPVARLAEIVDCDDVGVAEPGHGAGLALETLREMEPGGVLAPGEARRQDLDGDEPVEALLTGLVDRAHPAATEEAEELVAFQHGVEPGGERGGGIVFGAAHGSQEARRVSPILRSPAGYHAASNAGKSKKGSAAERGAAERATGEKAFHRDDSVRRAPARSSIHSSSSGKAGSGIAPWPKPPSSWSVVAVWPVSFIMRQK